MTIRRGPRQADNFTILPNGILRDDRLSFRARGLAAFCLSQPPGFTIRAEDLAREAKEGREAVRSALNELEEFEYLHRERLRLPNGSFVTECVLYDLPTPRNTSSVPPAVMQESPGRTGAQKTDSGKLGLFRSTNEEGLKEELNIVSSYSTVEKEVFDYWKNATGRELGHYQFTDKRKRLIRARLKDGYTPDDLKLALDGLHVSPWHNGDNPSKRMYDDLENALRDAKHVEQFMEIASNEAEG